MLIRFYCKDFISAFLFWQIPFLVFFAHNIMKVIAKTEKDKNQKSNITVLLY